MHAELRSAVMDTGLTGPGFSPTAHDSRSSAGGARRPALLPRPTPRTDWWRWAAAGPASGDRERRSHHAGSCGVGTDSLPLPRPSLGGGVLRFLSPAQGPPGLLWVPLVTRSVSGQFNTCGNWDRRLHGLRWVRCHDRLETSKRGHGQERRHLGWLGPSSRSSKVGV